MPSTKSRTRGHIEQRASGRYRAIVYAGVDPLTGKERYLRESAPTKKAAQAALARLQTQVDERRHPRTGTTFGELLEQWMEVSSHENSTSERYADLIRLYLRPTFGATPAGKIDAELLEIRRKVLDLVEAGRRVAQVTVDLDISEQTIYVWRRQHLIDTGQLPGATSAENAELIAARRRIAELEAEVAIHRRAAELLGMVVPPKGDTRRSR